MKQGAERIIRGIIAVLVAAAFCAGCRMEQDYGEYQSLREPRITTLDSVQVMVCEVQGPPDEIMRSAMRILYKAFDQLQAMDDSVHLQRRPLRARWPEVLRTTREEWVGLFALPVPSDITELPVFDDLAGAHITLEYWTYGTTAEILHPGSYDTEEISIDRLHRYIIENSYRITGMHEEEYLSGPGLYFDGSPDRYLTVIRYPVRPIAEDTERMLDYAR